MYIPRAANFLPFLWYQETDKQKLWTAIKVRVQMPFCEDALTSFDRKQMT